MRPRSLALILALAVLAALAWLRPWPRRAAVGQARTIVLLAIDTLRRDRVGAYRPAGSVGPSLTPNLDALAARGVVFEDARTPVPLTLPAHATMLTGLPPAVTGVRLNAHGRIPAPEMRGYPLLPERLLEAGWRTAAFVSASPLAAGYGLDQGFEHYDDEGLEDETGLAYAERAGEETVRRALAWLDRAEAAERVFLFVHLFEPHAPHAPHLEVPLPLERAYDHDVALADRIVGSLLAGLRARGRAEAAILVTADHGEALDDLGERTHGLLLGDAVLRVPFLLRAPGLAHGRRTEPVDLADVAPTLARLAGVDLPERRERPGWGRDLLGGHVAAGRIRVAESLFAHHLYGWAQLVCAIDPANGGTLVDAGLDRLLWLESAPHGEPQRQPSRAEGREGLGALGDALRAYRQGERPDRISGGGVAAGYGHAAQATPFLPPTENGRLVDPYAAIDRHFALDLEKQRLAQGVHPRAVLARLQQMRDGDPANPELLFWIGRAWQALAQRAASDIDAARARAAASSAYLAAWERGRRDAWTLALAVGVDAAGREAESLEQLDRLATEVPRDCQLLILRARLLRRLGRDPEARDTCREAENTCRTARERALFERERARETCR